jgi:hypothetical protein
MELSPAEHALCARLGFEEVVAKHLKKATKLAVQQLTGWDSNSNRRVGAPGLRAVLPPEWDSEKSAQEQQSLVETLQPLLVPLGYLACATMDSSTNAEVTKHEIAVLQTDDSLDFVRAKGTAAPDYGLSGDDILAKLERWKKSYGLIVTGAAPDFVALELGSVPPDVCKFAIEVFEFCPDCVQNGTALQTDDKGFVDEARELCPDVELDAVDKAEFEESGELEAIENGIRLLALHVETTRSLFLWWD